MAKFLIPGGTGYAGARLTEFLIEKGAEEVFLTSRTLSSVKEAWILSFNGRVSWKSYDSLKDKELPFFSEVDAVINLAVPSASEFSKDSAFATQAAVNSALASARYVESYGKRLIHFSSFHVYGSTVCGSLSEETSPAPTHPYGVGHLTAERRIDEFAGSKAYFILRPCNSLGRPAHSDLGVQTTLLFFDCCKQAIEQGRVVLHTNGLGFRDFLSISDLFEAVQIVLTTSPLPRGFRTLNVSRGRCIQLRELVQMIQEEASLITGKSVPVLLGEKRDVFSEAFTVSHRRLSELGWNPRGDLRKEIHEILRFFSQKTNAPL